MFSKQKMMTVGLFVTLLVSLSPVLTTSAHASHITDVNVAEQKIAVQHAIVHTLEEQLKLLQMVFIIHLETRLKMLEAELAAH